MPDAAAMTTFFLVRHAPHQLQDRVLVGRLPGIALSGQGQRDAARVAARLAGERLTALVSSPRERTLGTAAPIAALTGLPVATEPDLDEIDIGEWTGTSVEAVSTDPRWRPWNEARGTARIPGGESMAEVRTRVVGVLDRLSSEQPDGRIAAVSHGDVIRAALLHVLGLPLDAYGRIEVAPASVSTVVTGSWGAKVIALNERLHPGAPS